MQDLLDFLEATINRGSNAEEAFRRYDALAGRHVEVLRQLTKQIQDARMVCNNDTIKKAITGECGRAWDEWVGESSLLLTVWLCRPLLACWWVIACSCQN